MITGYGEVMRDLPGENTPENIQIIIDEATRLSTLVNDLLDLSKIQSGSIQPENLNSVLPTASRIFSQGTQSSRNRTDTTFCLRVTKMFTFLPMS